MTDKCDWKPVAARIPPTLRDRLDAAEKAWPFENLSDLLRELLDVAIPGDPSTEIPTWADSSDRDESGAAPRGGESQ